MRFHVFVTPIPDEPLVVDRVRAVAGLAWLEELLDDGTLEAAEAFPATGGYMIVEAEDFDALTALLDTYPLRETITVDVHRLVPLHEGFDVLLDAIERGERL